MTLSAREHAIQSAIAFWVAGLVHRPYLLTGRSVHGTDDLGMQLKPCSRAKIVCDGPVGERVLGAGKRIIKGTATSSETVT